MNKCRNPQHPHCTRWVMQDAATCMGGHAQPAAPTRQHVQPATATVAPSSFDLISARRSESPARPERRASMEALPERRAPAPAHSRPVLHVSGFDPRAAGGRQALRLELRGMPPDISPRLSMHLKSALLAPGHARQDFARTRNGEWPPAVIEFSSRGREHGQYLIEVELLAHRDSAPPRRWTCTVVVLVPRADASLTEIHQTFLATHKNVRIVADDASIARLGACTGGGRLDIDLTARNASIAQVSLDAGGNADLALASIAWDEELIETGVASGVHPAPTQAACLVDRSPGTAGVHHIRLFAFDECVLGRLDGIASAADVLLSHYGEDGPRPAGLTRRISAQHAVVRRGLHGFEIEDISRYGLLLDGVWPGKYIPVALRPGMRIELTASVRNIVTLEVTALLAHGVVLHRVDAGQLAECFCILAPGRRPTPCAHGSAPGASLLPVLYHADGGFWHLDRATGRETPLADGAPVPAGTPAHLHFTPTPYPDLQLDQQPCRPRDLGTRRSRALLASA